VSEEFNVQREINHLKNIVQNYDSVTMSSRFAKYLVEQFERMKELEEELGRHQTVEDMVAYSNEFKVAKLKEANRSARYNRERFLEKRHENEKYREAREEIERVFKSNHDRNAYGYEDGYLDGLDTAMDIIDKELESGSDV